MSAYLGTKMLKYEQGNVLSYFDKSKVIVIPHICNNIGGWGSGFVLSLSKKWPQHLKLLSPEYRYRTWYRNGFEEYSGPFGLGQIQICVPQKNVHVINMIAQNGVKTNNDKPIKYEALVYCMRQVQRYIDSLNASSTSSTQVEIQCPKFGSGLAGGNWSFIEELINEILTVPVNIYTL